MSVPNQKIILIKRESDKARKDFFKVSNENLNEAMYNLKPSTFMLWVYFADNANGYKMDLYPVDFCTKCRISDSTYRRGMKELQEKGYLVQSDQAKNIWLFKEVSTSDKIEKREIVKSLDEDKFEEQLIKLFSQELCQNEINGFLF